MCDVATEDSLSRAADKIDNLIATVSMHNVLREKLISLREVVADALSSLKPYEASTWAGTSLNRRRSPPMRHGRTLS